MKNIFLAFVCLLSLAVSRGATAEGYIERENLKFETKYQWSSRVVTAALFMTPLSVAGFGGKELTSVGEILSYKSNFGAALDFMTYDWFQRAFDRIVDGLDERLQEKVILAYENLMNVFDDMGWGFSLREAYYHCVMQFKPIGVMKGTDEVKNFCSKFARNMVAVNNEMEAEGVSFREGPVSGCRDLIAERGLGFPVVCGGKCKSVPGTDDLLALYYSGEHKVASLEFDDLCDGKGLGGEFWYVFCNSTEYKQYGTKEKALENINAGCGNVK